jgi:hypothetical protein
MAMPSEGTKASAMPVAATSERAGRRWQSAPGQEDGEARGCGQIGRQLRVTRPSEQEQQDHLLVALVEDAERRWLLGRASQGLVVGAAIVHLTLSLARAAGL